MNRLLYPLVASALITIVPFLLTFEKGQDFSVMNISRCCCYLLF